MSNTILLAVDVQKGFSNRPSTAQRVDAIIDLVSSGVFDKIILTRFVNNSLSPFVRFMSWGSFCVGDDILFTNDSLVVHADAIINKDTYSAVNPDFMKVLTELNDGLLPEEIFIAGFDTDCSVLTTATDLFRYEIRPVVLTQYCASNGGEVLHQAGLLCLNRLIGKNNLIDEKIKSKKSVEKILKRIRG